MDFNGEIVFAVSDKAYLNINFGPEFLPTKIINKGEIIALGRRAPQNRWMHIVEYDGQEKYLEKLELLVNQLYEKKEYVIQLINKYEAVSIDIYIRSEFAEIGYSLPSCILKKIAILECDVNFNILSFGMAIKK